MKLIPISLISILLFILLTTYQLPLANTRLNDFPKTILWAWERPEDLRFLDSKQFAVAFLAQTLTLNKEKVHSALRRQPLNVNPQTKLMAVTRIETEKFPALSSAQRDEIVQYILKTLSLKNVSAIQIDFDAKVSQRGFYKEVLQQLRANMPENIPLSMTALASFCLKDTWIKDLPVDEAVPMIFRMGMDNNKIKSLLKKGTDFSIALCQHSYGIATDEPLTMNFDTTRRIYIFKGSSTGWTKQDIDQLAH